MNANDRKHLYAHLAAAHDGIQLSIVRDNPHLVKALEELLLAVKIIADEVEATDRYLAQIAKP